MSQRTGVNKLGSTFFGATPTNSTDGASVLGREYTQKDKVRNYERETRYRLVRNGSGAALLPSRIVALSGDGRTANGYALDGETNTAVVDELLPAAGVASNDIFWVAIKGPQLVLTALGNDAADYAVGNLLAPITAATSGATTAGRVKNRSIGAATADATAGQRATTENLATRFRAMSLALTNSTNNLILVDINPW